MNNKNGFLIYGLVSGFTFVILSVGLYLAGLMFMTGVQLITFIPLLAGLIMNGIAYSKANDGYVTYGNVFGNCFKASLIAGLIMLAWSIASLYVFPEMKDKVVEAQRQKMMLNPQMTDEQIEMVGSMTRKYYNMFAYLGPIFGSLIFGSIFSLIAAAVAKTKGERPFGADDI